MAAPQGFGSHYTSLNIAIDFMLRPGKKGGVPRGWRVIPYDLNELRYLLEKFPPAEILSHGKTCDPSEVVRLVLDGKSQSQIADVMKLSKATVAASFRRWYLKARELQAAPSRFSEIEPSE